MADAPEVAFALFLEHGLDCRKCRTSDRPCETGRELLRLHHANRPDVSAPPSGASARCDCCGREQELVTFQESRPTGPTRALCLCKGCAPQSVARDRFSERSSAELTAASHREQQGTA